MTLRDYQRAVTNQIQAGFTFGQVEGFIDACPIGEQHKTALWLWAWAHQPPETQRRFADSLLHPPAPQLHASSQQSCEYHPG